VGAAGRLVEESTVVPGADLLATRELFHGAHITRAATKATAPKPASRPVPIPRSGERPRSSRISFFHKCLQCPTAALRKGGG
jgi:hypothetical protein